MISIGGQRCSVADRQVGERVTVQPFPPWLPLLPLKPRTPKNGILQLRSHAVFRSGQVVVLSATVEEAS